MNCGFQVYYFLDRNLINSGNKAIKMVGREGGVTTQVDNRKMVRELERFWRIKNFKLIL